MDFSDESLHEETLTEEVSDNCVSAPVQVPENDEQEVSSGEKETQRTRDDEEFKDTKLFESISADGKPDFVYMATRILGTTAEELEARYKKLVHDIEDIESSFAKSNNNVNKKKQNQWTQEEHRQFLEGLELYGKGNWKSISRNCLPNKTPTQIASHAQKYYLRQVSPRKRASIHDITTTNYRPVIPDLNHDISQSQPNNNVMPPSNTNTDVGPRNS